MSIRAVMVALAVATASSAGAALPGLYAGACYAAAEHGWPVRESLMVCTLALRDRGLSLRDRGATLVNRGIVQYRARQTAAAIADYDKALEVAPGLAEARVNKAIALVGAGRDREAIDLLSAAIADGPAEPEVAYYTRAMANEDLGALRAAYDDYTRAAALAPGWSEPAEQLRRFTVVRRPTALG